MVKNNNFDMDLAVEALLRAVNKEKTVNTKKKEEATKEVVYDGYGTIIEIDGVKTHNRNKRTRRTKGKNDIIREVLMEECEAILQKISVFENKIFFSKKDGMIIRLSDADYSVKVMGHSKKEFDITSPEFKPTKSFVTRGKTINHSSLISKSLVDELGLGEGTGNIVLDKNKGETNVFLCEAKASGIRVNIEENEFTIKISKKRDRAIIEM